MLPELLAKYRIFLALACCTAIACVAVENSAVAETRTVTAESEMKNGKIRRWLLGSDYRDLWTTPIDVEVLDLHKTAGGLRAEFRVGGLQTYGLALKGGDGRSYTFRRLVKDLGQSLPEDFREHLVDDFAQDQLAALHPAATLVVPSLAKAIGVLHTSPRLVILPDDPLLGEFRADFAGRLGTFEEYPTAAGKQHNGFHGATEIISTEEMFDRLLASPRDSIDTREYLRARLLDFLVGDWDKHPGQWRWAKLPGKSKWQPIPEDRDVAFSKFEGGALTLFRPYRPTMVLFEEQYPSSIGLTSVGWQIHRWLLASLEKPDWLAMASEMREGISDEDIEAAARNMPAEYYRTNGAELVRTLQSRRDKLPQIAGRIYDYFSTEVDVHGTAQSELAELHFGDNGELSLRLLLPGASTPYYQRNFQHNETKTVRVYLHGGNNEVRCTGNIERKIGLDIIGQRANDVITGCENARLRFNEEPDVVARKTPLRSSGAGFLPPDARNKEKPWFKPRDWKTSLVPVYVLSIGSDQGLVLGGGVNYKKYAFGKPPYSQNHTLTAAYSFGLSRPDVAYKGVVQHWNPKLQSTIDASVSGLELRRFYGFGNETEDDESDSFYETEQLEYNLATGLRYVLSREADLFIKSELQFTDTDEGGNTLLNVLQPEGAGEYAQIGLHVGMDYDTRDRTKRFGPGVHVRVEGSAFPEALDVDGAFAAIEGEIAGYFPLGEKLLLGARVAGRNLFGSNFPFHEAAYIGGNHSVRGFLGDRFAGDASVYANTELRYTVGRGSALLFAADWGVFAFADIGRVYLDGENSNDWHPAGGIGVSAATLERAIVWTFSVARSEERTTAFVQANFSF